MYVVYVKEDPDFPVKFLFNPTQALKHSKILQKMLGERTVVVEKIVTKDFLEGALGTETDSS